MKRSWNLACTLLIAVSLSSCVSAYKESVGVETELTYKRVFFTDFNRAWLSVLDALKHNRLDVSNREGGFVQTKWTDNTDEKNFVDSFGGADSYLKAQYRVKVTVAKTFFKGKPAIRIAVHRDQLVKRDVLEGWQPIQSDSIEEHTLLYRIGRIILMRTKLAKIEEQKTKEAIENTTF